MIKVIRLYEEDEESYNSVEELKEDLDKYDDYLLEGNPTLKREDLKHEIYYEYGYFILDDSSMKLYDANEFYRAIYNGGIEDLKEVAVIDVKRWDRFADLIRLTNK